MRQAGAEVKADACAIHTAADLAAVQFVQGEADAAVKIALAPSPFDDILGETNESDDASALVLFTQDTQGIKPRDR